MSTIRKQTAFWVTKEGQRIRVCDLGDRHLLNCLRLLERTYSKICLHHSLAAYRYADDAPDGAAMCAESAAEHLMEAADTMDGIEEEYPIYPKLLLEAERRGLNFESKKQTDYA